MNTTTPGSRALDSESGTELDTLLYDQLRRLAEGRLRQEGSDRTAPTSLVHEALLRIWSSPQRPADRGSILARAAVVMRRLLVDRARRRQRFEALRDQVAQREEDTRPRTVLALDDAMTRLHRHDPELARVVDLRFLLELDVEECAGVLGLSTATVKRRWRAARGWLAREVQRILIS